MQSYIYQADYKLVSLQVGSVVVVFYFFYYYSREPNNYANPENLLWLGALVASGKPLTNQNFLFWRHAKDPRNLSAGTCQ